MGNAGEVIERMNFLDTETALIFFGNNAELFVETVKVYLRDRFDGELDRLFEEEDWTSYQRVAHSIKSSSNMIGAKGMFEMAKRLEMAAKVGDADYVKDNHVKVMNEYRELLDKIEGAL